MNNKMISPEIQAIIAKYPVLNKAFETGVEVCYPSIILLFRDRENFHLIIRISFFYLIQRFFKPC